MILLLACPRDHQAQEAFENVWSWQTEGFSHWLRTWESYQREQDEPWQEILKRALEEARLVLLLLSPDFLNTEPFGREAFAQYLEAAQAAGARILVILLSPTLQTTRMSQFPRLPDPDARPLNARSEEEQEEAWDRLAREVWRYWTMPVFSPSIPLIYVGHTDGVNVLAWSPDGTKIASGGGTHPPAYANQGEQEDDDPKHDYSVQVWEATTGRRLLTFGGHTHPVCQVAWSPDGTRLASVGAQEGTVQVWDAESGRLLTSFTGHSDTLSRFKHVQALAWSPDGTRLASAGGPGQWTVQVWEAATGQTLLLYHGHEHEVYPRGQFSDGTLHSGVWSVAWSPDGRLIASGGDRTVQVWEADSGQHLVTCRGHGDYVYALTWVPDGQRLASADIFSVRVWEARTGQVLALFQARTTYISNVAWSHDGRYYLSTAGGSGESDVCLWDAESGQRIYTYRGHVAPVKMAAWSPDGTRIASGGEDKTIQVWQAP